MKAKPLILSLCLVVPFAAQAAEDTALESEFLDFLSMTAPEVLSCQKTANPTQTEENPAP